VDIDERLAKLTERHEALVISLEILTHDVEGLKASSASLRDAARDSLQGQDRILQMVTSQTENIIAQQRNIDGLQHNIDAQQRNIDGQQRNIDSLLEIARSHENRLTRLENGHSGPAQ